MSPPAAPSPPDQDRDPGLFGPDSVTWRVHAEPVMALAGLRALLLQALHPRAVAGVARHSSFRADPWGRLLRTAEYVGVTTYGTTAEATRAGAHVRGLHRRSAVDPDSGASFRLDEPELLLWVHCCEAESFLTTAVRCGLRLSPAERDRYYAEQVRAAGLVGVPADDVPASVAAMTAYFDAVRPALRRTEDARRAARFVLWPPMPTAVAYGTPARGAWAALAGAALAMLPRWARRMYALPGLPTTDVAATAAGVALRSGLLALPERVRVGPSVRAARRRLEPP